MQVLESLTGQPGRTGIAFATIAVAFNCFPQVNKKDNKNAKAENYPAQFIHFVSEKDSKSTTGPGPGQKLQSGCCSHFDSFIHINSDQPGYTGLIHGYAK